MKWSYLFVGALILVFVEIPSMDLWIYQEFLLAVSMMVLSMLCVTQLACSSISRTHSCLLKRLVRLGPIKETKINEIARTGFRGHRAEMFILTIFLFVFGGCSFWFLKWTAGDLLLPRIELKGRVEQLMYYGTSRPSLLCGMIVSGQYYRATYDVFKSLKPDDIIHAEVGRGSRCILKLDRGVNMSTQTESH